LSSKDAEDASAREQKIMRRMPTPLLLAVAFVASGPCLAQHADATTTHARASDAPAAASAATGNAEAPRSAFGKVIAIMISSLQHKDAGGAAPVAPVHTSAAGTPLGIEVGEAFRSDASGAATSGKPSSPPALPPPDYAVQQPALAGPG
jgi:hypothetical protein